MKEIICASQAELDALSADYNGRVIIKFGTPFNRAVVKRRFIYPVVARENSSVEARENSSVVAWGNSSVVAWGNSSVVARENSFVEAWGNSFVEAWGNSFVEAWGNSSVEAWGNSSVVARGNSQIIDNAHNNKIKTNGNARIVYTPKNIEEYIDYHGLIATATTIKLYKAVHFCGGIYCADYDPKFIYEIGGIATPRNGFNEDDRDSCGAGINLAHKAWALAYGATWKDLAILELECEKSDVLVPIDNEGKVRARKAKVLREVPLEECGLHGKIIAKRRANDE